MPAIPKLSLTAALLATTMSAPATAVIAAAPAWTAQLKPTVTMADSKVEPFELSARMAHYHVPAVSVVTIDQCRIAESYAIGFRTFGGVPITPRTRFQAASISKAVTAVAALRLVEQGRLSLDSDVRHSIPGWTPQGPAAANALTLRQLLSHTGGINVSGFEGYGAGKPLPSFAQILAGQQPANNAAIRMDVKPGSEFRYSGGGYTLAQALMTDRSGEAFSTLVSRLVLQPLKMTNSSFAEPERNIPADVALGHDKNGKAVPGGWNSYPELAAAGLWSTPEDLARFAIGLMHAARGDQRGTVLKQATVTDMLVPQSPGNWGLGVELRKSGADSWFMHTGENEGYLAIVAGLPSRCSGLAVMMNGDGGAGLLREVVAAVTKAHGWPQIIPTTTLRPLDAAKAKQLAGTYSVADPPMSFDIKPGESGGPEFFLKGASRGRIFADATGRILVVTADLAPLAEVRTTDGEEVTVMLGGRRYNARRASPAMTPERGS